MLFALMAKDKPGALDVRLSNREAHVAYLKSSDAVKMAGPFLNEAGDMCGSLIVLEFETLAEAEDWAANDPYKLADLFESSEIQPWNKVIG